MCSPVGCGAKPCTERNKRMLVYTSEVANAINEYQAMFGHRISVSEIDKKVNEDEFVAQLQQAIASKTPVHRYGGTYNPVQAKKIAKRKATKPVSPLAQSLAASLETKTSEENKRKKTEASKEKSAVAEEKPAKNTKAVAKKAKIKAKTTTTSKKNESKATSAPSKNGSAKVDVNKKASAKAEPKTSKKTSDKTETKTTTKKTASKAEAKPTAKKPVPEKKSEPKATKKTVSSAKKAVKKTRKLEMESLF